MNSRYEEITSISSLRGKLAIILFIATLIAFVVESQLTQYVQTTLGYRNPFFIFYLVHSSFAVIFPIHLLYLTATTKYTISSLSKGVLFAITNHLTPEASTSSRFSLTMFPRWQFLRLIFALTVGVTLPALLWFASVSLASISDVTAIWNTNAFFAYIFTVKLFGLKWERRRLIAVILATLGVAVVIYGGSASTEPNQTSSDTAPPVKPTYIKPSAPLVGDLLTLVASIGYAFYQVAYKKYAALPSDPEVTSEGGLYQHLPISAEQTSTADHTSAMDDAVYPPPFGFYSNLLTTAIGICTLSVLWIFIPILHHLGVEQFSLPTNITTVLAIAGIAVGGVVFNAGFMILLGVWGPIIVSVGNLLTIVLVFISDILFGAGAEAITPGSVVGCSAIVFAFALLAYDMVQGK